MKSIQAIIRSITGRRQGDESHIYGMTNRQIAVKWFCVMAVALLVTMTGCKKETGDQDTARFEGADAVSLRNVMDVYDKYVQAKEAEEDIDLFEVFYGKENTVHPESLEMMNDTTFALQLPEYAGSTHPFLSTAEVFYNSCLLGFSVWSDHEVWLRGYDNSEELVAEDDIIHSINAISENCIRNPELRNAAKIYKDSILIMMQRSPEEWDEDEHSMYLLMAFGNKIENKSYKYFTDEGEFAESLDALSKEVKDATKPALEQYKKMKADERVRWMLQRLNDCSTFDEQCSLFLNWADSPQADTEDEWIIAVAENLMNSGKYHPYLDEIWIIWRCLFQYNYGGLSRDADIPNSMYNDMRKKCYVTCLKWIETHPNDTFAINCAMTIAGRYNINRFGQYMFGNDAVVEKHCYLSGREETEEAESEEAEEAEDTDDSEEDEE